MLQVLGMLEMANGKWQECQECQDVYLPHSGASRMLGVQYPTYTCIRWGPVHDIEHIVQYSIFKRGKCTTHANLVHGASRMPGVQCSAPLPGCNATRWVSTELNYKLTVRQCQIGPDHAIVLGCLASKTQAHMAMVQQTWSLLKISRTLVRKLSNF